MNYITGMRDRSRFLDQIERALPGALDDVGPLGDAARHLVLGAGAKRARPLLAHQLSALFGERVREPALLDIALATELIHSASLLHDDVIDSSDERRGRPTANRAFGNITAVLAGDLVLSRALKLLRRHPAELERKAMAVVEEMTRAAFAEVRARGDYAFPLAAWREMAEGKSGALFGLSGALLALLAGDDDLASRLDEMGRHLGVAFQIADDLDDLDGTELPDLRDGNPSYPVLLAAHADPSLQRRLSSAVPASLPALAAEIRASGAIAQSRRAIALEVSRARAVVGPAADHLALRELWSWASQLGGAHSFEQAAI